MWSETAQASPEGGVQEKTLAQTGLFTAQKGDLVQRPTTACLRERLLPLGLRDCHEKNEYARLRPRRVVWGPAF